MLTLMKSKFSTMRTLAGRLDGPILGHFYHRGTALVGWEAPSQEMAITRKLPGAKRKRPHLRVGRIRATYRAVNPARLRRCFFLLSANPVSQLRPLCGCFIERGLSRRVRCLRCTLVGFDCQPSIEPFPPIHAKRPDLCTG